MDRPGLGLRVEERALRHPEAGEIRLAVRACAVCRTDLHVVDGDLEDAALPIVPGHQVVGVVDAVGLEVHGVEIGERVGVPWLGWACGQCHYCATGAENLCNRARFTGYHRDGGFAEHIVADARFCFPLPEGYPDAQAAPLLCAGLIGYRALRMAGEAARLGFYGFGSAAHVLVQIARYQGRDVYAFTRPDDEEGQRFALEMGATWAGPSDAAPPVELDAALLFAPVGALVPAALRVVRKGGAVVCAGIHMSDIPSFPYRLLWGERTVRSVANLTRRDAREFLELAPRVPVRTEVELFALEDAEAALDALRHGRIQGAAVIVPQSDATAVVARSAGDSGS